MEKITQLLKYVPGLTKCKWHLKKKKSCQQCEIIY